MALTDYPQGVHVKSRESNPSGNCVEVAWEAQSGVIALDVQDSKDVTKPHLSVSSSAWSNFVSSLA